jgi:beta-lactamase regulating signal transducer with metallopeptidase domain
MDVVLNWLWQGALVAAIASVVLRVIPQWRTHLRHRVVWAGCLGVLALPAVPYVVAVASSTAVADASALRSPVLSIPIRWWTSTELVLGLWIIWSGVHAVQLATAATALRRAKEQGHECPTGLESRLHHWTCLKLTGRRTRLMLSTQVRSAAVLGGGSPVIALAPALLESVTDEDLDRVVIHEWAHVQRRDDVGKLVQQLIRVIAGWHPAIWWFEQQLDLEREAACDEMAVAITGSAKAYAACLTTLAALRLRPVRPLAGLAAVSPSGLRDRIVRILAARPVGDTQSARAVTVGAGVAFFALTVVVGNTPAVRSAVGSLGLPNVARPPGAPAIATSALPKSVPIVQESFSSLAPPHRARAADEGMKIASGGNQHPAVIAVAASWIVEPPVMVEVTAPSPAIELSPGSLTSSSDEAPPSEAPAGLLIEAHSVVLAGDTQPGVARERAPWAAAVDAGLAVGRGSRNAGVAAAGFFTRFSKNIADSF